VFLFIYLSDVVSNADKREAKKMNQTEINCAFLSHMVVDTNLFSYTQGEDSVEYFLGLTPSGIIVLRNKSSVAHYYWPRIAKVHFKGRYFMIRVCDKNVSFTKFCI
jgi:FERM C-terminal PH-like domain